MTRKFNFRFVSLAAVLCGFLLDTIPVIGQPPPDVDRQAKIATLRKEMDDAIEKVKAIVNQPVPRVKRTPSMRVVTFKEGWFHEGATKPHFRSVDVRATQEFPYAKYPYVTSDLNPGYAFPGAQLEFNSMTKYFYTDRTVPKKKLTQSEMIEINRLYQIIGDRELKLTVLERPPPDRIETVDTEQETLVLVPPPRENYVKAAIGVCIVLVLYAIHRMIRKLQS